MLALVVLAALEAGLAPSRAADGDAQLEQPAQRGPLAQLRAEDVDVGPSVRDREEGLQRSRGGGGVVVQDPDPLGRVAGLGEGDQAVGDRVGEAGVARPGALGQGHPALERRADQVGAAVAAAGVDGDDVRHRGALREQSVQHGRQPGGPVVADEETGDVSLLRHEA